MTPERRLTYQRNLSEAAQMLGHWLEEAGSQPEYVPAEIWARIRDAAARIVAAASALASDEEPCGG